ncbi:MAG: hypothetical protein D6746_11160 [Bacteroidetes bacterium]|nr:MAG: hypothetical protein D6746_11160 [Bacteroidota bacterium]
MRSFKEFMARRPDFLPTRKSNTDELLEGGLHFRRMTFLFGPPKTGKTTWVLDQIVIPMLLHDKVRVIFFSLEMPKDIIIEKMMVCLASDLEGAPTFGQWMRRHEEPLSPEAQKALALAYDMVNRHLEEGNLIIIDTPTDPRDVEEVIRRAHKERGLPIDGWRMVVIWDHVLRSAVGNSAKERIDISVEVLSHLRTKKTPIALVLLGHTNRDYLSSKYEFMMPESLHVFGSSVPEQTADLMINIFNPKAIKGLAKHWGIYPQECRNYVLMQRVLSRYGTPMTNKALFYEYLGEYSRFKGTEPHLLMGESQTPF